MASLQQKAVDILKVFGYRDDGDGGFILLNGNGAPVDSKWVPQAGTGFLRFDRADGQWEAILHDHPLGEEEVWIWPDEDIIRIYKTQ